MEKQESPGAADTVLGALEIASSDQASELDLSAATKAVQVERLCTRYGLRPALARTVAALAFPPAEDVH